MATSPYLSTPAAAALADAGLDLIHAFDAGAAAREPQLAVLAGAERLGLLVGNSRALWPRFLAAPRDPHDAHPLDHHVERAIGRAFAGARVYFGHRQYGGAFVPLQALAVATGLGAIAPSHLVIHPTLGPWFALRAVILVAGDPPPVTAPIEKPCECTSECPRALERALAGEPGVAAWRTWLAVRDACSLRAERYSEEQIRYHYSKVWPD